MSQQEQYEVVCKRCGRKETLDYEPPEDYTCFICGPVPKPIDPKTKTFEIRIKPKGWRCDKHNQTFKPHTPCPECEKEATPPLSAALTQSQLVEASKKIRDEIDISKTEWGIMKKIRDHKIALEKSQVDMPVLFKQFIEQQTKRDDEILKELKQLNKNLEDKNES